MKINFESSLRHVLVHEGGYVDHPSDPGGATNKGVTLAVFQRFFGAEKTKDDLKTITDEQLEEVYETGYWDKCRCNDLPDGVDYVVFDQAVNSGPGRSARWLQSAVGATVDGGIGPLTIAATTAHGSVMAIDAMCEARLTFLKSIRDGELWEVFGGGWQRRVDGVRQHGLALAGADLGVLPTVEFDVVRRGDRGPWVTRLQQALGIEADGIFGAGTERALKTHQSAEGLNADGVAGRNTYRSLGLVGWIFSPPRKFLESCRGLVE